MHRVEELATKNSESRTENLNGVRWVLPKGGERPPYISIVPLMEIIAEAVGSAPATKKVQEVYFTLVNNLGSEFNVLLKEDTDEISKFSTSRVAEGVKRVRSASIVVEPGYDGKFGVVKIWPDAKMAASAESAQDQQESQLTLFA